MRVSVAALAVFFAGAGATLGQESTPEKPIQRNLRPSELSRLLAEPIDAERFQSPLTLKEFLAQLSNICRVEHGKELAFRIDERAFQDDNADASEVAETQVSIAPVPRSQTRLQLFRAVLCQVPTNNAAFLMRPGFIVITTGEKASMPSRLAEGIYARIDRRPLHLALEDLSEQTGVGIVLDPRIGPLARNQVSFHGTQGVALGTLVDLLATMANLKMIVIDDVVIVTTPVLAQQMLWERFRRQFLLPDWSRGSGPFPFRPRRIEGA